MAEAFRVDADGSLSAIFEEGERDLMADLAAQTLELLGPDDAAPSGDDEDIFSRLQRSMQHREAPEDPALRRLLPDGVKDDDGAAQEFRRLTEGQLRDTKRTNLWTMLTALQHAEHTDAVPIDGVATGEPRILLRLPREDARAMMTALTDIRLVLAQRLGVETEEDADRLHSRAMNPEGPSDLYEYMALAYDFMSWVSESLTMAYMGR